MQNWEQKHSNNICEKAKVDGSFALRGANGWAWEWAWPYAVTLNNPY